VQTFIKLINNVSMNSVIYFKIFRSLIKDLGGSSASQTVWIQLKCNNLPAMFHICDIETTVPNFISLHILKN
jgi:hypothetical protein